MKRFTSYALLGSGHVARHLEAYLSQLNIPFATWSRRGQTGSRSVSVASLKEVCESASHVLLAISDPAIAEVAAQIPPDKVRVHFSGIARVAGVFTAHPLMTFGSNTQSQEWYRAIPFVVDKGVDFARILPGLPNPHFAIDPQLRPRYHALCALAGNSTFLLWQKIARVFAEELRLPQDLLAPFLHQVVDNALGSAEATGPVAREDWATVRQHLESLNPQLQIAYRQFLNQAALAGQKIPEALL